MKLCIPIEVRAEGGMFTFVGNFTAWLEQNGVPFTKSIDDQFDVLFANSWAVPLKTVARLKRSRPQLRVAHRIDGSATDYGGNPDADRLQARVNLFADVTIFQSEYGRHATREKVRVIAQDGPIIWNPVDLKTFDPDGERIDLPRGCPLVACASFSVNPFKGGPQIDSLAAAHPDVTFVLLGRFDAIADRPNVVRLGHLGHRQMAAALRSCDVFLNLSLKDTCPNVVLEALASGLPVLFVHSGGVPEIVGDCGEAIVAESFRPALDRVLASRATLSACARQRAVEHFNPDRVFPKYMNAIEHSVRRPLPSAIDRLRLAGTGYPVLPRLRRPAELALAVRRRAASLVRSSASKTALARVGWITYDSFPRKKRRLQDLDSFTAMRVGNVADWINANDSDVANELYDPSERYDIVVFQKMMDTRCQDEAARIKSRGGKVVFDANVNYYELWGDYFIPGTRPTDDQQRDARAITAAADWVVADSSYLEGVIKKINPRVTWIPDNVDTAQYVRPAQDRDDGPLRLIWSGVAKKAAHLLHVAEAFASVPNAELILVVDEEPAFADQLRRAIKCRFERFSPDGYARLLAQSDIIISPKALVNAYELGHTEYKITLGMACGLPAIASPQQSYLEAVGHRGGGVIAATIEEWRAALVDLAGDPGRRRTLGELAHQTVIEKYATPIIARQYLALLRQLTGLRVARQP